MAVTLESPARDAGDGLAAPSAAAVPAAHRLRVRLPSDAALSWVGTFVVTAVAAALRFWAIASPKGKVFDEVYYATEGHELLQHGYEANPGYLFIVHPPLGKWFIAAGEYVFGYNEVGWRVPSAVAGTLCVLLLTRVVRRMTRSTMLGCVAGLLLALDGLSLVQSRVALLDIFLALLVLAGFACLLMDRDAVRARAAAAVEAGDDDPLGPRFGPRPWRLAGGALLGLACGVKWSGGTFLLGFALLSVLWTHGARRVAGTPRPWAAAFTRGLPSALASFVVVPLAAYLATWTGWFLGENSYDRHWGETHRGGLLTSWLPSALRGLVQYHKEALNFHSHLDSYHPYKSSPWSWLVDGRPLSYYYPSNPSPKGCGAAQCVREILAIGTPALWWAFVPALLWMAWWLVSRLDWRAGVVLVALAAGWGVWLLEPDRTMFLFYMTPLVPFLVMAVTLVLGDVLGRAGAGDRRRTFGLVGACGYVALVVVDFVWMYPLFTGGLLSYDQWHARIWFPSWI